MIVETPYGTAKSWTEAHELLKKNGVQANEENFKPVGIELSIWEKGGKLVRMKYAGEVADELNKILKKYYPDLYDKLDHGFSPTYGMGGMKSRQVPIPSEYHWIGIYVVRGTSEGFYIHVDFIKNDDSRELYFLAKTFFSRDDAYDIAKVCAELLDV